MASPPVTRKSLEPFGVFVRSVRAPRLLMSGLLSLSKERPEELNVDFVEGHESCQFQRDQRIAQEVFLRDGSAPIVQKMLRDL